MEVDELKEELKETKDRLKEVEQNIKTCEDNKYVAPKYYPYPDNYFSDLMKEKEGLMKDKSYLIAALLTKATPQGKTIMNHQKL